VSAYRYFQVERKEALKAKAQNGSKSVTDDSADEASSFPR
jgi:hypothetical protein